ncbi:MAG: hypothetical protein JW940_28755 [Polyangiaceae bacterium]|nr:hypothetical protein [Polyangiaceae bacterium]
MKAFWRALVLASLLGGTAHAEGAGEPELGTEQLFEAGVEAIRNGATEDAIDDFELLADRGVRHPDLSFNRAVAYVKRARSARAKPGDLGRAAAALSETLMLRPGDELADEALTLVRSEIARKHARVRDPAFVVRPSIARSVVALLSETAWSWTAVAGSLLLTAALIARTLLTRPAARLGAALTLCAGAAMMLIGCGMMLGARHFRMHSEPAIVVVDEAPLLGRTGAPIAGARKADATLPEGALVYVLETAGSLDRVQWGEADGWVLASQLRVLREP